MRCRVAAARKSRKSCKPHNAALLTRRYPNLQPYLPQQTLHGLKHHGIGNHRK